MQFSREWQQQLIEYKLTMVLALPWIHQLVSENIVGLRQGSLAAEKQ